MSQSTMFPGGDDLPLFSGTPVAAVAPAYAPRAVAGVQAPIPVACRACRDTGRVGRVACICAAGDRTRGVRLGPAVEAPPDYTATSAAGELDPRPQITDPADAVRLVGDRLRASEQEELYVLHLDTKHRVIGEAEAVYRGTLDAVHVRMAELFRGAVRCNACAIVVLHNHPSGDPTPSDADVRMTRALAEAGKLLDIPVLDHIVVGRGHKSLRQLGVLGWAPK